MNGLLMVAICITFVILLGIILAPKDYKEQVKQGYWEVVHIPDEDEPGAGFYKVRWSLPDEQGRYLWVRHYGYDEPTRAAWCKHAAERSAEELTLDGRHPKDGTWRV